MKIIDLTHSDSFNRACEKMRQRVFERFCPDVAIGIATGGERVLRSMNTPPCIPLVIVRRARKTTNLKKTLGVGKVIKFLPAWLNKLLRVIEILCREALFVFRGRVAEKGNVSLVEGDVELLKNKNIKLLVVDDSVDSGGTLKDVEDFVLSINSSARIYTASLSQTFLNPVKSADFTLFEGRVLVRGPWALDSR